jgi:hypothetical protein
MHSDTEINNTVFKGDCFVTRCVIRNEQPKKSLCFLCVSVRPFFDFSGS